MTPENGVWKPLETVHGPDPQAVECIHCGACPALDADLDDIDLHRRDCPVGYPVLPPLPPLAHPRDLLTPEQQAQMDRDLSNMADNSSHARLNYQKEITMTTDDLSKERQKTERAKQKLFASLTRLVDAAIPAIDAMVEDLLED